MMSHNSASVASSRSFRPARCHETNIWQEMGIPAQGSALNAALARGIDYNALVTLAACIGLAPREMVRLLGISRSTLLRREKKGRFTQAESDRIYRMAKVYQAAIDLFEGDNAAACRWLKAPVKGLGYVRPIDMLQTMAGTETVLDLIGRLEHGIPA
jgi:putative toxin-antitoxin system antitoxin component (TIGR02293 family)